MHFPCLPEYGKNNLLIVMIKIPAFVIGGLLILTGIFGYLMQDPGLSMKITGPLAEDTKLILSDGKQKHELDLGYASSDAAGEHAYWIIYNLNLNHAKDTSQGNYAVDEAGAKLQKKSFWYASSKGETMNALVQESDNYQGAGNDEAIEVDWSKVDIESSTVRFVFKNQADSPGPITLQSNNWKNIDISSSPKSNEKIEFKKSWTAFIPGILGLILILLTLGAAKFPNAHKHFMHVAVLIGLIGFIAVAGKVGSAVSEMNLLKSEPFMIIHVSSLKPTTMLLSAGLLLIFVILCIVSFIEARKNRAAEEKKVKKPAPTAEKKESKEKNDSENKASTSTEKTAPSEKTSVSDKKDKVSDNNQSNKEKNTGDTSLNDSAKKNSAASTEKMDKPSDSNDKSSVQSISKEKEKKVSESSKDKESDSGETSKNLPAQENSTESKDKKSDQG